MKRNIWLSTSAIALVILLLCGLSIWIWSEKPAPNIIYILADDLGYGELGSYGQELISTPNIDRLAAEGLRFTQHYAGSSLCNPSRYSLMTGQHAGSSGVTTNRDNTLPERGNSLGKLMREAGYTTGTIGKWALGSLKTTGSPLKQGFDYFYGYSNQVEAHAYYPEFLWENDRRVRLPGNKLSSATNIADAKQTYAPAIINQKAIDFIIRNQERPFYLQVHYTLPHINNELQDATGNGFEIPGPSRYENPDWTLQERAYAEMVSLMDDYVGQIINTLETLGLKENTVVFFSSDNGPSGVRSRASLNKFNATGGLRGMKGMLFEGGIRVPLIAWWPGTIEGGIETHRISSFWDMLSTLVDLSRSEATPASDGISLAPLLLGNTPNPVPSLLYWAIRDRVALRKGPWKWVHHPMKNQSDFLFNLDQDPGERHDLAGENRDKLMELMHLAQSMTASPSINSADDSPAQMQLHSDLQ